MLVYSVEGKKIKQKVIYIFLVIITFLYIYYPPIFFANTLHVLGAFSWIIVLIHKKRLLNFMIKGGYIKEILFAMFMISYLYFVLLINQKYEFMVGYVFITVVLEILPISFVIIYLLNELNGRGKFSDLIIHVGFLQSIFSMLAFFLPSFQTWVINTMLSYGYNNVILKMAGHRMFGLSYTLPFSMPIVQGIIACLSVYLGINKSRKYFFFTPLLIFSGIINARIFIVIFLIGVLLILLDSFKFKINKIFNIVIIILVIFIMIRPVTNLIEEKSPMTFSWIQDGVEELVNLFSGDTSGYYMSYVTDESKYALPEGLQLIYGTSERVIRGNTVNQSDIGYINDIWFGGILYVIAIYGYLILKLKIIRDSLNSKLINGTLISLFLFMVIAFSNIKGTIYAINEFLTLFYLIYVYSISIKNNLANKSC